MIVAPITGCPDWSVTVPVTVGADWAKAAGAKTISIAVSASIHPLRQSACSFLQKCAIGI